MPERNRRTGAARVQFKLPVKVRMMAIDGTWCRDCELLDISDSGAQLRSKASLAGLEAFFLLLSETGAAYRHCKLTWIDADRFGVAFHKATSPSKATKRGRRTVAADAEMV